MKRDTRTAYRARAAATERLVDDAIALIREQEDTRHREAKEAARLAEANRIRYTAVDLENAVAVRDRHGWHRVVRVNTKTVTVATPYSWTATIPVDRVLEHRSAK